MTQLDPTLKDNLTELKQIAFEIGATQAVTVRTLLGTSIMFQFAAYDGDDENELDTILIEKDFQP